MLILDENARVVDLNEAAARLLQQRPEHALGCALQALLPGIHVEQALRSSEEHQLVRGDGGGRYIHIGAAEIRDGVKPCPAPW